MRPKLIALIAVPAFALVGCAGSELSAEPTVTVTVTSTPEPSTATVATSPAKKTQTPVEDLTQAELRELAGPSFYRSVRALAPAYGDPVTLDEDVYTDAFINYCLEGKNFTVFETEEAVDNLTERADKVSCPAFEKELNSR